MSNVRERKRELRDIRNIINQNREESYNEDYRKFDHGDETYIACYRDIHIVTGIFHINEITGTTKNFEYARCMNMLNGLDLHSWVLQIQKDERNYFNNIRFTKDSYTLLVSERLEKISDENIKSQTLFSEHKLVVTSSLILKNHVDMNQFTNYPIDSIIMVYRPTIDTVSYTHLRAHET